MANNDFLIKFLKDLVKILILLEILNFDRNRDNGHVFQFFS